MRFYKYQGTGNDFILIESDTAHFPPHQIKQLCDRRYGIGGDGLIFVRRKVDADAEMEIYNADGMRAEMCGNGLRSLIQYLIDRGNSQESFTIAAGGKLYEAVVEAGEIVVEMGVPKILEEGKIEGLSFFHIDSGVPHFVHFCNDIRQADFPQIAQGLRHHSHFSPSGVNVNFVKLLPSCLLQVRTYERGVEGETHSCGTGGAAACVAAWKKYGIKGLVEVEFPSQERLRFDLLAHDDLLRGMSMRGHAAYVFEGEIGL
ncbi:diaminopimelate epimerase [Simkania sp.]|uniref:diaminopimelate epimerase n=1 Tax=Simkania sp. TaxID=34094 RepID=UPI003B52FCAC